MKGRRNLVQFGREGEAAAAVYLEALGYRIVGRNVRYRHGEIDIVAMDGDALVFVEVKTRTDAEYGLPAEAVDRRKQRRLVRLAETFLTTWTGAYASCRFDVVSVQPAGAAWTCAVIRNAIFR